MRMNSVENSILLFGKNSIIARRTNKKKTICSNQMKHSDECFYHAYTFAGANVCAKITVYKCSIHLHSMFMLGLAFSCGVLLIKVKQKIIIVVVASCAQQDVADIHRNVGGVGRLFAGSADTIANAPRVLLLSAGDPGCQRATRRRQQTTPPPPPSPPTSTTLTPPLHLSSIRGRAFRQCLRAVFNMYMFACILYRYVLVSR